MGVRQSGAIYRRKKVPIGRIKKATGGEKAKVSGPADYVGELVKVVQADIPAGATPEREGRWPFEFLIDRIRAPFGDIGLVYTIADSEVAPRQFFAALHLQSCMYGAYATEISWQDGAVRQNLRCISDTLRLVSRPDNGGCFKE